MEQGILNSEDQWIHSERRPSFIHCILLDTLVICVEPPYILLSNILFSIIM